MVSKRLGLWLPNIMFSGIKWRSPQNQGHLIDLNVEIISLLSVSLPACRIYIYRLVMCISALYNYTTKLIIHPLLLYHSLLSFLYRSPQSLSVDSPQQTVKYLQPQCLAQNQANFAEGSHLSELWDPIIVPFKSLVNSQIKGHETVHK